MHDKKEQKQMEESLSQLGDQLSVKIFEMNDIFDKREQFILMLQRQLLENEKNLLEKKGLAAKNLCQLLARRNISVVSSKNSKEEAVDLKKEMKDLLKLCDEMIEKRASLNIKIQSLEESNRQLIKCINLYKKLSTETEIMIKGKVSNVQSDSPIFAASHPKIEADQIVPDMSM